MAWTVLFHDEFEAEFDKLSLAVQRELLTQAATLEDLGPQASRPRVDTLSGSQFDKMKELRFSAAGGEWRVAFAFDSERQAILLVVGDKTGSKEKRFYRELLAKADRRLKQHEQQLNQTDN